jgi:tetratricopeptide (TPR) repeat protein
MKALGQLLEKILDYYEKKEYVKAEECADELLAGNPNFHRALFLKGVILEETGRGSEAEKYFSKAGSLYTLYFRLALQLDKGDPERALVYYDRVLGMNPWDNAAMFHKGLLCERLGRKDAARECFGKIRAGKELFSRIAVPLGFMIFLLVGGIMMTTKEEKILGMLTIGMSVFCLIWLKRDAGMALKMFSKKREYR